MNKKLISCVLLGISACFIIYFVCFFQTSTKLSKLCVEEERYLSIMGKRSPSEGELIEKITFNDYKVVYDNLDHSFYYSLVENDPEAYDPKIGYTGANSKVKIAVKSAQIDEILIAENDSIELLAYDDATYCEYKIKCTTLPLVSIHFYEEPMDQDVDITFELFDNREEGLTRQWSSDGRMRIRGVTTASYVKKGYKITLLENLDSEYPDENQKSVLDMRSDGDWMLYAAYNDQEKIRNVFSANLWYESCADNNIFGVKNGMEYRYVETFFNDHYVGLYAIGFPVDELQLELKHPLKHDNVSEFMLKKMRWADETEENTNYEKTLESYEFQWSEDECFSEKNQQATIEYHSLLDHATAADIDRLYDIGDIENAIDVYLFYNLIQGVDNAHENDTKNLYLTYKAYGQEGRFLITPWDFDLSWGNEYNWAASYATGQYTYDIENMLVMDKNVVHLLLENEDEDIKKMIKNRYEELRAGRWSEEHLMDLLNHYEMLIFDSGAYEREIARWPHSHYIEDQGEKLNLFKDYVKERLKIMDIYVHEITR